MNKRKKLLLSKSLLPFPGNYQIKSYPKALSSVRNFISNRLKTVLQVAYNHIVHNA